MPNKYAKRSITIIFWIIFLNSSFYIVQKVVWLFTLPTEYFGKYYFVSIKDISFYIALIIAVFGLKKFKKSGLYLYTALMLTACVILFYYQVIYFINAPAYEKISSYFIFNILVVGITLILALLPLKYRGLFK